MNKQYGEFEPLPARERHYPRQVASEKPKIFVQYVKGSSPFGVWLMVGIVFFVELTDHGMPALFAVLVTMLAMLIAVILS